VKVKELISILRKLNPDGQVRLSPYGTITCSFEVDGVEEFNKVPKNIKKILNIEYSNCVILLKADVYGHK
jgi:hypothetical protein